MSIDVSLIVNGKSVIQTCEPNTTLVELIREKLKLTGTHVGCDTSQCGSCTVHLNGRAVKACTVLAAQVDGAEVVTIEGLGEGQNLHPMQSAFRECHGLQCGFCTPGMVMTTAALLKENPKPSEAEVRAYLEGNICRCTGYHNIVKAVLAASGQDVSSIAAE